MPKYVFEPIIKASLIEASLVVVTFAVGYGFPTGSRSPLTTSKRVGALWSAHHQCPRQESNPQPDG